MSATPQPIYASLEKPHVTLVLRRRSPAWELTIHNKAPTSIWLDHRTVIPEDDTLTISRHSRHPDFRLKISDHPSAHYGTTRTLQIEPAAAGCASVTITATYAEPVPTLPVRLEFAPLPPPTVTAPTLPLEVTVLPPHEGQSGYTLVRYRNTGTVPLRADGCPFPAGGTLTYTGRERAATVLHGVNLCTPDGTMYLVEVCPLRPTNGQFLLQERLLYGPLPLAPKVQPPPVFTAPTLPLEVTVLPPHEDQTDYTSTTDRLTVDGCDMPPGSSLTFIGREIPSPLLRQFHVTATDAINTLLRALATTHQAVATEILAARGLTPAQITAILGGLAGL